MPSHHSTTAIVLCLVALLASAGCQAAPTAPMAIEAPATQVEQVRLLTGDAEIDAADPVAQDVTVYLMPPVTGQEWVLPITYARGVEEVVDWPGTGTGSATLLNTHGQQVYRVEEGGAATRAVIPAGQYRLVLSGVDPAAIETATQLMLEVSVPSATRQERVIRRNDEDGAVTRAMDRRTRVACPAVADEGARIALRIAIAKGELVKLSRLRAAIKPIVSMQGTIAGPVSVKEFVALLQVYRLGDGEVASYYYAEVARLQKQHAAELFAAEREHRDLIDARCP